MKTNSRRIALSGMMTALAVALMLMGGLFPLATYACPALAGALLVPLVFDCGEKLALGAYAAVSILSLTLCADKEAALLFAFLGYYPVIKWRLDRLRRPPLRRLAKAAIMGGAIAAMYALIFFVLRLDQVLADYAEMTRAMLVVTLLLGAVTLALYDRALMVFAVVYLKKLRPKLMGKDAGR